MKGRFSYNYIYLLIALLALYVAFNLDAIMTFLGFPSLGSFSPFLMIALIFLAPVALMKMVGA